MGGTSRVIVVVTLAGLSVLVGCGTQSAEPEDPKPGDTFTNRVDGSELVLIPGGEFVIGDDESIWDEEKPAHEVQVEGFWLGKYEVTNEQYRTFMEATDHRDEPLLWDDSQLNEFNLPKQPVVGVSWDDAVAYCEWAGGRLPTEAEWEYAARGGKQCDYGTSTGELSHDLANYMTKDRTGVEGKDRWKNTSPVGSFPANPFGLYDLAGNVREWCSSLHKPYPDKADDGRENLETAGSRALRGGSWDRDTGFADDLRCAYRFVFSPDDHGRYEAYDSGFRLARRVEGRRSHPKS